MGKLTEYIRMAFQNILGNKGRSFLTMLGIIIGISSVITIVSIGEGTKKQMNKEVDSVGSGQIYLYTSEEAMAAQIAITKEDLEAVQSEIDGIEDASPSISVTGSTYTDKGDFALSLSGGSEGLKKATNLDVKYGNYFTQSDIEGANHVCVISDKDAKRLFGSDDVVGMDIEITTENRTGSFTICGVTKQKENGTFVSYSYEDQPVTLDVPYTSLTDFGVKTSEFDNLYVFTKNGTDAQKITNGLVHLLDTRHQSSGENYFLVQSFQDQISQLNQMLDMVTLFISFVAAISLLVGGIGVMNIMLVSVTERTREIGIRKALGAKTSSIMIQFLFESAILTALGGVLGIIFGIIGGYGICAVISAMNKTTITPGISPSVIIITTLFSSLVGIFFGIYPARKAAKLSPIEALRRV